MSRLAPRLAMPPRLLRRLGVAVMLAAAGCAAEPTFLLDSDIPAPQGASGRATSGIERRGAELVGVRTVFADQVDDPQASLDRLRGRFEAGGWSVESSTATGSTSTAVFGKGDRRCRVHVVRNDLDPAMSRIAYRLDLVAVVDAPAADG